MIRFRCPRCDAKLETPDRATGKEITCPSCCRIVYVPGDEPKPFAARVEPSKLALCLIWVPCMAWTLLWLFLFWLSLSHSKSAIQESSAASAACAHVIAGYIVARAIDKIVRGR